MVIPVTCAFRIMAPGLMGTPIPLPLALPVVVPAKDPLDPDRLCECPPSVSVFANVRWHLSCG